VHIPDRIAAGDIDLGFIKAHTSPKLLNDGPIIYIVRDGRDVMVSLAHYRKNNHPHESHLSLEHLMEASIEFTDGNGTWGEHVNSALELGLVPIRYDEMIKNPIQIVGDASKLVGQIINPNGHPLPDFSHFHAINPKFYRRGKVESYKDEMPESIQKKFMDRHGETMKKLGYA
jgi:hypothetical protein